MYICNCLFSKYKKLQASVTNS